MSEWPSLQECYWDMSREEEIQDDPQARLWLLIHLHKKDAEKVRWPDHLLVEDIESETTDESNSWARSMPYSQTDVDAGSPICDGQASHSKRPKESPQLDPQKEHFGAACCRSHLEHAAQELLISLDVVNGHQPSARLVGTLLRSFDHGCQGPWWHSLVRCGRCQLLSARPFPRYLGFEGWPMDRLHVWCQHVWNNGPRTSKTSHWSVECVFGITWGHWVPHDHAFWSPHLFHHCSHKPSYDPLQVETSVYPFGVL